MKVKASLVGLAVLVASSAFAPAAMAMPNGLPHAQQDTRGGPPGRSDRRRSHAGRPQGARRDAHDVAVSHRTVTAFRRVALPVLDLARGEWLGLDQPHFDRPGHASGSKRAC